MSWARLPRGWITDEKLKLFKFNNLGANIAALKIYISICMHTDFNSGKCSLSYTEFENIAGLSRAMVSRGLKVLQQDDMDLISVEVRKGYANEFFLNNFNEKPWAKIPKEPMYSGLRPRRKSKIGFLYNLNLRRKSNLNALKVYLYLCTLVDVKYDLAMVGYIKIAERTGVRTANLSFALSVLYEYQLVSKVFVDVDPGEMNTRYRVIGLKKN